MVTMAHVVRLNSLNVNLISRIFLLLITMSSLAWASDDNEVPSKKMRISPKDQKILKHGEVSSLQYYGGGALAIVPGFGLGHLVNNEWHNNGWKIAVGELGAAALYFGAGRDDDKTNTIGIIALAAGAAFKFWEIFDAWYTPKRTARRYHELKQLKEKGKIHESFIVPDPNLQGVTVGWSF